MSPWSQNIDLHQFGWHLKWRYDMVLSLKTPLFTLQDLLQVGRSKLFVEVVVSITDVFLLSSRPLREMIHFDLYFFFRSVGSKYYQTESCANFCIISVSKNTIATQDTNPEAIAEVFSRIDHKFDLMCLGSMGNRLWNLSCFGVFGASTAAISKTMGGNPWKESFPWRPTCCSFPVNAVACVLGHVHTGIAWFWQFESIFY